MAGCNNAGRLELSGDFLLRLGDGVLRHSRSRRHPRAQFPCVLQDGSNRWEGQYQAMSRTLQQVALDFSRSERR